MQAGFAIVIKPGTRAAGAGLWYAGWICNSYLSQGHAPMEQGCAIGPGCWQRY